MASVSSLGRFAKAFVSISCHLLPLRCCYLWPLVVMAIVSFLIQVQATQTTLYKMLGQNMARDDAMKFCWIQCFLWRHLASDAKSPNLKDGGYPRSLVLLHSCFSQDFHSHLDCSTLWWCASFLGPPTAASSDGWNMLRIQFVFSTHWIHRCSVPNGEKTAGRVGPEIHSGQMLLARVHFISFRWCMIFSILFHVAQKQQKQSVQEQIGREAHHNWLCTSCTCWILLAHAASISLLNLIDYLLISLIVYYSWRAKCVASFCFPTCFQTETL